MPCRYIETAEEARKRREKHEEYVRDMLARVSDTYSSYVYACVRLGVSPEPMPPQTGDRRGLDEATATLCTLLRERDLPEADGTPAHERLVKWHEEHEARDRLRLVAELEQATREYERAAAEMRKASEALAVAATKRVAAEAELKSAAPVTKQQ